MVKCSGSEQERRTTGTAREDCDGSTIDPMAPPTACPLARPRRRPLAQAGYPRRRRHSARRATPHRTPSRLSQPRSRAWCEAAGHYRFTYVSFAISRILLSVSWSSFAEDKANIRSERKISIFIVFPCLWSVGSLPKVWQNLPHQLDSVTQKRPGLLAAPPLLLSDSPAAETPSSARAAGALFGAAPTVWTTKPERPAGTSPAGR